MARSPEEYVYVCVCICESVGTFVSLSILPVESCLSQKVCFNNVILPPLEIQHKQFLFHKFC